jgi:hypothetical protein
LSALCAKQNAFRYGFKTGWSAWIAKREADRTTLIQDLLDGQYDDPVRIVAFNTAEGWSRDVTRYR